MRLSPTNFMFKTKTRKKRILSQARTVLQEIADIVGWLTYRGPNQIRFALGGYGYYQEWKKLEGWEEKHKLIQYLKRQKLLKAKHIGERLMIKLTEKGYGLALRDKIISAKAICPRGQCLVVFDIPETRRRDRDYFRRFLKE